MRRRIRLRYDRPAPRTENERTGNAIYACLREAESGYYPETKNIRIHADGEKRRWKDSNLVREGRGFYLKAS